MKRIFLVSMYVIASIVMFSCTDDTAETNPSNNTVKVVANGPGDGIISPPPITPPKP
jgi:hypothetical protein